MEWTYKKTIIKVESDGKFYFSINGNAEVTDTLEAAKSRIDSLLKQLMKIIHNLHAGNYYEKI